MIATWMVYAFVVSVLVGLAGWAFDRAARTARLPGRAVWLGSLFVSVTVPLYALANPAKISGIAPVLTGSAGESNGFSFPALPAFPLIDAYSPYIAALWVAVSGVLLAISFLTLRRIASETETLPTDDVDGIQVRRSVVFGPALVGVLRQQVVIPRWLGAVHPAAENLAARHEVSHRIARDAEFQLTGLLLAIAMPWNPAVWWQFQRLREAVELDCDIRLLRGGADMKTYATLLLEIAGNRARSPFPAVAFLPKTTQLGRRVTTMAEHKKPPRYLKTALIAAAGIALAATACETPQPAEVGTANESAVRAETTAEHFGRMRAAEATFEYSDSPGALNRVPAPAGAENEFTFQESEMRLRQAQEERAAVSRFGPRPEN